MSNEHKNASRSDIVRRIRQDKTNRCTEEFDGYLEEFLGLADSKNRKDVRDTIEKLLIAVLFESGQENQILQKYIDKNRLCFEQVVKGNEKHIALFSDYFSRKLIDAAYKGFLNNIDMIKEIYQERVDFINGNVFSIFDEDGFVALFKESTKVKNSPSIMQEELIKLAKIKQKFKNEAMLYFKEQYKKKLYSRTFWGLTLREWLNKSIQFYLLSAVLLFFVDIFSADRGENMPVIFDMVMRAFLASVCLYVVDSTGKFFVHSKIKRALSLQLNERFDIDWSSKAAFVVVIKSKRRTTSAVELMPPAPQVGMSGHAYVHKVLGGVTDAAAEEDEDIETALLSQNKAQEHAVADPDALTNGYRGEFNSDRFALGRLGVPSEMQQRFISGYNKGIAKGRGGHHPPGIHLLTGVTKGWRAELVPTGSSAARILATETVEDGIKTLCFRQYQPVHDVRNWPEAPQPLPPKAVVTPTSVGLNC
jgi:hypothetical protein